MTEYFPSQDQEPIDLILEVPTVLSIDRLPEGLGFIETEEMSGLRAGYVAARLSGEVDVAREMVTRYHLLGEQVVEQYEGEVHEKLQIGLEISIALLRRDAGATAEYVDNLNDAFDYASNRDYEEVAYSIEAAKSDAIADVLRSLGEEYGFDPETCNEVAALPFYEAFETTQAYLLQAGLDALTLLEPFKEP